MMLFLLLLVSSTLASAAVGCADSSQRSGRRTCKVDNISAKANSKPQSTTAERAKDSPSKVREES